MAERSLNLREMNARGIYLSEHGQGGGVEQIIHARMLSEMKERGLSVVDAFRNVLSEDRDLRERYERAPREGGDVSSPVERFSDRRLRGRFLGVE